MYQPIDCHPGMMVFGKISHGIRGDFKPKLNQELIAYAVNTGIELPLGFHPSMFERDMLRNDFKKFQLAYNWSPHEQELKWAKDALRHVFGTYMYSTPISYDEAIDKMDKTRSPGFPWNLYYLTKEQTIREESALLRDIVEQVQKTGSCVFTFRGVVYRHVYWQSSPKGEMRVMDKLIHPDGSKRKCRTFMCADIVMHICMMMLFSEMNDQLLNAHSETWSKVGFSPFYGGFNLLSNYLLGKGSKLFDCYDVAHMEASLNEWMLLIIYELRGDFLLQDCSTAMLFHFVRMNVIWSYVIDPDGWLCLMFGKNPSGSFNTLSDNTLALILVLFYVLARKSRSYEDLLIKIDEHRCACVGDDSVVPHHPDFSDLISVASELGFVVKPERPTSSLDGCVFTNCEFVVIGSRWFPKANFNKVEANIFFHFKAGSWRLTFIKCCALRVLAWNYPEERDKAERMIQWISKKYDRLMRSEVSMDDKVTYRSAMAAYLPRQQVDFMWNGNELGSSPLYDKNSVVLVHESCLRFIVDDAS
jgi:hypothetical protein